ncbi:olfactory receptor [Culex quinquefasciatus]|uniref:Olfactory receptor n=1 Tax=Culex quinquefasciatus TaxID=7176 RepID=B0WAX2_CULQU|nr:olfactory receptor [Culex quinquefasciatus]|eukprot:XP_001845856.1 olfactory receptor [Culex quinquefasciatus]
MDATQRIKLPEELQVMPFSLRFLELVGLWGPRGQLYRFYLPVTFATMVILFPKAVLGIGSSDVTAICKGIAEFVFELAIFVNVTIIAVKRKSLESVIQGLGEIFYEQLAEEAAAVGQAIFDLSWYEHPVMQMSYSYYLVLNDVLSKL